MNSLAPPDPSTNSSTWSAVRPTRRKSVMRRSFGPSSAASDVDRAAAAATARSSLVAKAMLHVDRVTTRGGKCVGRVESCHFLPPCV